MRWVAVACATIVVLTSALACQSIAGLGDFQPEGGVASGGGSGGGANGPGQGGGGGATLSSQAATAQGGGGAGGDGGSASGSTASTGVVSSSGSTSSASTSTSTGSGCDVDHLVISEVRTRGPDGGNQDFVELLNPTPAPIALTAAFHVDARGETSSSYAVRWTGDGTIVVQPGKHVLLVNDEKDNPLGGATADAFYDSGIPDGASVVLYQGTTVLDAVCFTCETASLEDDYVCERPELARSATCGVPGDESVQRKTAGTVDGCADTDDNSADLAEGPSSPAGSLD